MLTRRAQSLSQPHWPFVCLFCTATAPPRPQQHLFSTTAARAKSKPKPQPDADPQAEGSNVAPEPDKSSSDKAKGKKKGSKKDSAPKRLSLRKQRAAEQQVRKAKTTEGRAFLRLNEVSHKGPSCINSDYLNVGVLY